MTVVDVFELYKITFLPIELCEIILKINKLHFEYLKSIVFPTTCMKLYVLLQSNNFMTHYKYIMEKNLWCCFHYADYFTDKEGYTFNPASYINTKNNVWVNVPKFTIKNEKSMVI
jgi:hypothetical protein